MGYAWRAWEPAIFTRSAEASGVRDAPAARRHRQPVAPAVAFTLVSERSAFDALEPEWNDLFRRAGRDSQLFQTFNWNWHWANHYLAAAPGESKRRALAIVTARRNGRLVMVWPLVAERVAGLEVLRWMGEPVSQYGDVLAEGSPDTHEIMRQAWQFLVTALGANVLHLRKVRADATVAPLLRELGLRRVAVAAAPFLDLASARDFGAYEQRYSAKARKNRRRLMRRLEERGPVAVERHTGGERARAAALEAIALKRACLEATGRLSPALADPRFAAFFADVAEGRGRPAGCGVSVLTSNGETAGIAIDVTCGRRRAAHVIVHDPRLDAFSPGTLLLQEWIRGAGADAIATFDLLAPAYPYKLDWADETVAVADFALGLTLAGRAYAHVYLALRPWLKRAAEAVSSGLAWLRTPAVAKVSSEMVRW
jgi:CelD/BcsL family acetyltransferase involved in cellulose biosynthesis